MHRNCADNIIMFIKQQKKLPETDYQNTKMSYNIDKIITLEQ